MPIPRHEVAPATDQEWAEALKDYGCDRDDAEAYPSKEPDAELDNPRLFDPEQDVLHASPPASPSHSPHRALQHKDSFECLNQLRDGGFYPATSPHHQPTRQSTLASTMSASSEASTHTLGVNLTLPVTSEEERFEKSSRGSFGSEDGIMMKDPICQHSALGIAYTVGAPPRASSGCTIENDSRSRQAERDQLREHYEREGWLPGPVPSRNTKLRRKRAIRRLGLCCNQEESQERQAVMAKYAELAKQIFEARSASVSILMGEEEILWGANPEAPAVRFKRDHAACSHAVLREDLKCFVVADLSRDWRFRNNPILPDLPGKFYASAPLRYKRNGLSVDIGTLCIFDKEPRDTFDTREQSILLNLANMLVYQMITLQSEIMAKKSSAMYENCISFLRRSVAPNQAKMREEAEREKREQKEKEREERREQRKARNGTNGIAVPSPLHATTTSQTSRPRRASRVDSKTSSSAASVTPEAPQLAVKTGPRDSKAAKREATMADKVLFTDAAKTMRKILKADAVAIVNIDEYQLFIRRATAVNIDPKRKIKEKTKEAIITSFLQGKSWPDDIDPVIHYVPRSNEPGVTVLGTDSSSGPCAFHFDQRGAERTLSDFLETWLKTKHFWWDREDAENDDLSRRIVDLMPNQAQTILGSAFMTWEGKCRFAMFVSWNKPPAEFGDSQTIALPFAWIMGGCTMAALAIRTVRNLEQSQISYSNLQAHELRTPLHQILAITQLLRSSMNDLADTPQSLSSNTSLTTTQQIRDLLPFLDAIDTSGKTLHGIVDNILSFLDLKGKDNMISPASPSLLNSPSGVTQSIEVMFEELIHEACEEDKRSRRANGQPMCHTETVFEIIPPLLGEQVTEDAGGALRRALSKILSNAYKFIEGEGCVEIYVDDVSDLLPPEGCEDLALSKRIKIKIVDNGKGMEAAFVQGKLGEPWAKEDPYATGSGLSVHLAYRIIDLMGGHMEITSGPGQGCIVELEVPVPRRIVTSPASPEMENTPQLAISDPVQLAKKPDDIELGRKVALVGFDRPGPGWLGLSRLQEALQHQYSKLGCELVDKDQADLVVLNGRVEETVEGVDIIKGIRAKDVVFLVGVEHEAHSDVLRVEQESGKTIRRFRKPATPSILRESLFPGQSKALVAETSSNHGGTKRASINSPEQVNEHGRTASISNTLVGSSVSGDKPRTHFAAPVVVSDQLEIDKPATSTPPYFCPIIDRFASLWKPRKMDVEEAVACLSLGDYFSSRKRSSLHRVPSNASSSNAPTTPTLDSHELDSTSRLGTPQMGSDVDPADVRGSMDLESPMELPGGKEEVEEVEEEPEELVKVMVVEDNMVNRKILVKILSSKLPIEVCEAEDGHAAVELFKSFTSPVIVLLDINMPKMDGYQACTEMRAIEKAAGKKHSSQIIAVTALGGEEERRRGLVECGMNQWHTKPCSKAKIHEIVQEAREVLVEAKKELKGLGLQP